VTGPAGDDTPIRVLLADDQEIVRRGFAAVLEEHESVRVVGQTRCADAPATAARLRPDVVLADVRAGDREGALLMRRLHAAVADAPSRIAILTATAEDAHFFAALRAGVSGFLHKELSPEELVEAVRSIARGYSVISPMMTTRLLERFEAFLTFEATPQAVAGALTQRELDVLIGVGGAKSNQEIAAQLHLAPATVKSHLSSVFSKLGLRNRVHAALFANLTGLVDFGEWAVEPAYWAGAGGTLIGALGHGSGGGHGSGAGGGHGAGAGGAGQGVRPPGAPHGPGTGPGVAQAETPRASVPSPRAISASSSSTWSVR
jgi:DNA-binding NarL/FixJ family response regulator